MSKDDLLGTLDSGFTEFLSAVDGLSDEAMARVWYGDWCLRDILAHVAGWHREMAGALERMGRGERPVPEGVDYANADLWNARFAEAQGNMSPAAMAEELKASQAVLREAARRLPEERFEEARAAYRILHTAGIDHYREHGPPIRAWRETEGI